MAATKSNVVAKKEVKVMKVTFPHEVSDLGVEYDGNRMFKLSLTKRVLKANEEPVTLSVKIDRKKLEEILNFFDPLAKKSES